MALPVAANLERLQATHYRFRDARDAFGTARWVPLSKLLSLGQDGWAPDDFGPVTLLHYAEAASFIAFLFASKDGQRAFSSIYRAIRDGEPTSSWLDRESLRKLDAAWRESVQKHIHEAEAAENGADPPAAPGPAGGH